MKRGILMCVYAPLLVGAFSIDALAARKAGRRGAPASGGGAAAPRTASRRGASGAPGGDRPTASTS